MTPYERALLESGYIKLPTEEKLVKHFEWAPPELPQGDEATAMAAVLGIDYGEKDKIAVITYGGRSCRKTAHANRDKKDDTK